MMVPSSIATSLLCILAVASSPANAIRYFPQRTSAEAAVVEWGHSAIISALDGAVATFGPQTSQGANFEVETSPVLANPIDGVGTKDISNLSLLDLPKLDNANDVLGNMVIMTDSAGLSGVAMARIAKESGAAALMIVNTDQDAGDYIFSLEAETDEEAVYAKEHIDIPVIMVSLQAGNVITTALLTDDMDAETVNKGGALPDRVRLYAGGDRPFFEDAISNGPVVYMIHNMLTGVECDELVKRAEGRYDLIGTGSGKNNYLENTILQPFDENTTMAENYIERVTLWKGGVAGKFFKDIDERISQVTGFPPEHFSDFQINKHSEGSFHEAHLDVNPSNSIMATITIFLNDVPHGNGGEFIFPNPSDGNGEPVVIFPTKSLAIVYHNTGDKYNLDLSSIHQEAVLSKGYKFVAKKYVYLNPQQRHMRIVLPLLASPFGGKLPRVFIELHSYLIDKFGFESAEIYFRKIITMIPILLLVGLASVVSDFVAKKLKSSSGGGDGNKGKESNGTDARPKKSKTKSKKSD